MLCLGPGLSFWLHVMLCWQLSAFRSAKTPLEINLKMLPMSTQQIDYLSNLDENVDAMLTLSLVCYCLKEGNRVFQSKYKLYMHVHLKHY